MPLVERVGDAEDGGEAIHGEPRRARERRVRGMIRLRAAPTVVAREVRDDFQIDAGEPEDFRIGQEIVGVAVMAARRDETADVVDDRRHFQEQKLALTHPVLRPRRLKDRLRPSAAVAVPCFSSA